MIILGLTGGIATGKSTVSKFFVDAGIPVIDCDLIARELLNKGTETYKKVIEFFSSDILLTNDEINRKMLGRIIFSNHQKREQLNNMVHPQVRLVVEKRIKEYKENKEKVIVVDVPLLFETNYQEIVDKTIVVYAKPEQQLERLMSRDHISEEYAKMRIDSQMPLSKKIELADYVVDNSYSILSTKKDYINILKDLEV